MAKGEVLISEEHCKGCGYCAEFCSRDCIEISKDNFNAQGFPVAVFVRPEKCNVCGICVWMCPSFAVETYKLVEK